MNISQTRGDPPRGGKMITHQGVKMGINREEEGVMIPIKGDNQGMTEEAGRKVIFLVKIETLTSRIYDFYYGIYINSKLKARFRGIDWGKVRLYTLFRSYFYYLCKSLRIRYRLRFIFS
jgi:hypothetical protein